MTQFADIICRNVLTGAISEFGRISNVDVHQTLLDLIEGKKAPDGLFYVKEIENFVFAAYRRIKFTDPAGKERYLNYNTTEIDQIVNDIYKFLSDQTMEVIEYAHDIQYLIGALNGISVVRKSDETSLEILKSKLEQVNLVSILVSAKSAFFRYLTEDTEKIKKSEVSITGKVYKIHKGIDFLARSRGKKVTSEFNASSDTKIDMVDIFEFVPYIIVENAIKYGPNELDVDFRVHETKTNVYVDISSLGPIIGDDEFERIYDRGYRGQTAIESGLAGHGMGLFQVQKASAHLFGGEISARQIGTSIAINGNEYKETIFTIRLPKTSI